MLTINIELNMIVFATISDMERLALVLDTNTGSVSYIPVVQQFIDLTLEAPCRPFGITWSDTELYIANNLQLLIYDRKLRYVRTAETPLQINTHQLAYHLGRVWAVSPRTNSLIVVDVTAPREGFEFDLCNNQPAPCDHRRAPEAGDRYHFNSLLWARGCLFVAAHNFGRPSFINRYDAATLRLDHVYDNVGFAIHGLAFHNNELFWISTQTGEVRSSLGYYLPLSRQGYARGFAVTENHFVIAISELLHRERRHSGDSWIQIIDRRRGLVLDEFHLRGTGSINDLRLLDDYDYGHHVDPFLKATDRPWQRGEATNIFSQPTGMFTGLGTTGDALNE